MNMHLEYLGLFSLLIQFSKFVHGFAFEARAQSFSFDSVWIPEVNSLTILSSLLVKRAPSNLTLPVTPKILSS